MTSSRFHIACFLTLGALQAVAVSGCAPAAAEQKPEPPNVTVAHPETRSLKDFDEYNGWTEASATVEVRSRVRGHVHKVHFTDGQFVNKDDLLFELDPRPFQSEIDRANEDVNIAKAQQEAALQEETRQLDLFEQKATKKSDVDKAVAARKTWDAQIVSAEEEVKRAELEMTYSRITAPIGGKMSRALLTEGNLVNAGGTDPVMTTIVAVDPIQVYFAVDERALLEYRNKRRPGTETTADGSSLKDAQVAFDFRLETDQEFSNHGVLDFAENKIDAQTGTIEVRGTCENADGRYVPGSRVRVRVPVSDEYQATIVPDEAILSDQDKKYLLCLNKENLVIRRDVQLGRLLDDGMRVILPSTKEGEGITADDWIIVLGIQRARLNYPVTPLDENGEAINTGASPSAQDADESEENSEAPEGHAEE
jgi:multidrug efflux system membrane fusion protein